MPEKLTHESFDKEIQDLIDELTRLPSVPLVQRLKEAARNLTGRKASPRLPLGQ